MIVSWRHAFKRTIIVLIESAIVIVGSIIIIDYMKPLAFIMVLVWMTFIIGTIDSEYLSKTDYDFIKRGGTWQKIAK